MIKFLHQSSWIEIGYTIDTDVHLPELMQHFKKFLLSVGYQQESIEEYIPSE